MSHPEDSADKPVLHDKNPHNYRKVGFSMIVISVSLVAIGLLVWAVGDNYHFSSDIMAAQEVEAMTPKHGYSIVVFDYTQPIGAKLKVIESTDTLSNAQNIQSQEAQQLVGQKPEALIFDSSKDNNTMTVAIAEVYALTPNDGYQIVSFNTALPVGAKLSSLKLDEQYTNATNDIQFYADQIKDPAIHIIILGTSFDDNLKQVLGAKYTPDLLANNLNKFPQKPHMEKPVVAPPVTTPPVTTNATQTVNQTVTVPPMTNTTVTTNQTTSVPVLTINGTMTNQTMTTQNQTMAENATQTNHTTTTPTNQTSTNQTATNSTKTLNLSENVTINSTGH